MTFLKWTVRSVCFAVGVILLLFLAVQIQQRTLRWRAERLSADMRQIHLYQSTWADAQRLMKRWGAWGRYEGSCTAESCSYRIEMTDLSFHSALNPRCAWVEWLLLHDHYNLYHWFGGRGAGFYASFTVKNGTIWREGIGVGIVVSSRKERRDDDYDRTLFVSAESYQRLHKTIEDPSSVMGSDEQLAVHPYYKVGRPGGCKINCQMVLVSYSTRTPPAEIKRLTSYEFSCFTRFNPCTKIEEVLPAAQEWHLYREDESNPVEPERSSLPKTPCNIPVWALARDARYILAVEVLLTKRVMEQEFNREMSNVRVIASLKEPAPWLPGAIVTAFPFPGDEYDLPPQAAEHLISGRRFIVFPIGNDRRDQRVIKDSPMQLARCGVQEDNPEMRREIEKGLAQNDTLSR